MGSRENLITIRRKSTASYRISVTFKRTYFYSGLNILVDENTKGIHVVLGKFLVKAFSNNEVEITKLGLYQGVIKLVGIGPYITRSSRS